MKRFVLLACLALPAQAQPQAWGWDDGTVPYVQTPMEIVERMLRMAEVKKGDHVIDLGSGDGRIVIEAAKRGATGLGVDLDGNLVKLATKNAKAAGVGSQARFEARDIFETDLTPASVVTMYLLPDFNVKLLPRLLKLKPGTRIVSHDGSIGDWPSDEKLEMRAPEKPVGVGGVSTVELWVVPADAGGTWTSEMPDHGGTWRFRVRQKYQMLDIDTSAQGRDLLVRNSRLRGEELKIVVTGVVNGHAWHHYFVGRIKGERVSGDVTISDGNVRKVLPWTATRAR
ncbi:MAG: methyltransferase domain-containing protein [Betaproteobacteria bacterium]|nr:MAG: methyltransferase domain-containing protein [Betaproteobacteria bacterium]